jgi:sugar lactone lactonase YvrE
VIENTGFENSTSLILHEKQQNEILDMKQPFFIFLLPGHLRRLFLMLVLCSTATFSANGQIENLGLWTDYLPYNEGQHVTVYRNRIYIAVPDALFYVDKEDFSVHKFGKLQGLSDNNISYITTTRNLMFVGYENGNVDILDGDDVQNLSDLRRSPQFQGQKRINHMNAHGNTLYLSTNFGIQTIDLNRLFFRETFIIGPGASQLPVYATYVDEQEGFIYAATQTGLKKATLGSQLIFFGNWTDVPDFPPGACKAITKFNDELVVIVDNGASSETLRDSAGVWVPIKNQNFGQKKQLRLTSQGLLITSAFNVTLYDTDYEFLRNISVSFPNIPEDFAPNAAFMDESTPLKDIYIADGFSGFIRNWNETNISIVTPRGPKTRNVFHMDAADGKLWVAPGAIDEVWTSTFNNDGIFSYENLDWTSYRDQLPENLRDVIYVQINPRDKTHVFACAWGHGLLEFKNGQLIEIWNAQNTNGILQSVATTQSDYRLGGIAFDEEGNVWVTNSLTNAPLVVRRENGQWENFTFGSLAGEQTGTRKLLIGRNGYKYIGTRGSGLLIHSTQNRNQQVAALRTGEGNGNLPSNFVQDLAEDLNGEIWIGTASGLSILFAPENIFEPGRNADSQPALIQVDGTFERLLGSESITAIKVDGANKKWIGTSNSGVFYISADGAEIIHNFTETNSPLLSNSITSIAIDQESGEVFFGTDRGIVSFRGAATRGQREFTDVYAYPNPVRPEYEGPIAIRGLVTNAQVKITDIAGNLVFETRAEGGQALWFGTNMSGRRVSSGVYLALLSNDDGSLTEVTKILVVR